MTGPLADLRVIDMGHVLAGPFAATLLADLGADVIKVEPPSGDYIRAMTWPIVEGVSLLHLHTHRGDINWYPGKLFKPVFRNHRGIERGPTRDDCQSTQIGNV